MNYENSKYLTDTRFKRLVGVERTTFKEMHKILRVAHQAKHSKGGRKPKMSLEDILMATLQYLREYRTYEQIADDFGVHESHLIRRSHWVEEVLVQNGFSIGKATIADEILADSGYQGLIKMYPQAKTPKKSSKLQPLTKGNKSYNKEPSSRRVKVENVFAKIKVFKIFLTTYRNHKKRFGLRINLVAGIINFETQL